VTRGRPDMGGAAPAANGVPPGARRGTDKNGRATWLDTATGKWRYVP